MGKLKAVIFDFDGVLAESNMIKEEAFIHLADQYPDHKNYILDVHQEKKHLPRKEKFETYASSIFKDQDPQLVVDELSKMFSRSEINLSLI